MRLRFVDKLKNRLRFYLYIKISIAKRGTIFNYV